MCSVGGGGSEESVGIEKRDVPGGPVAKTLCFQCRGQVRSLVKELDRTCHK